MLITVSSRVGPAGAGKRPLLAVVDTHPRVVDYCGREEEERNDGSWTREEPVARGGSRLKTKIRSGD